MKVTKSNFNSSLAEIKSCISNCKFLSFDLEMTGINFDLKTEAHKYDSYQLRYKKSCEIVKKYEVVEVGLSFYFEKSNEENVDLNKSQYYSERTFTFTLLRNSKLKNILDFYTVDHPENIFASFSTYNPDTHRFLNSSNFNFDNLYKDGINYSKLALKDKIRTNIQTQLDKGKPSNSIFVLSKANEKTLLMVIIETVKFLLNKLEVSNNQEHNLTDNQNKNNNKKKNKNQNTQNQKIHKISGLSISVINYLLSLNLRKITKLSNFNISRDKADKNSIVIEKSKAIIKMDDFLNEFISIENFIENLNMEFIKKKKFALVVNSITKEKAEEILNEELGFSQVIELIIDIKPKIVGHNILFDLLFIYEKFCDFFPDSFIDYCKNINYLFPNIYDTKYLIDKFFKEKDFDHTNLVYIYEKLIEEGYSNYVSFIPEIADDLNNAIYIQQKEAETKEDLNKFHSAGFDALITARCFVNIMKALENNYLNPKNLSKVETAKNLQAKKLEDSKIINVNKEKINQNNINITDSNNNRKKTKNNSKKEKKDNNLKETENSLMSVDPISCNIAEPIISSSNKINSIANNDVKPMEIEDENKSNQELISELNSNQIINHRNEDLNIFYALTVESIKKEQMYIKYGWVNFNWNYPHLESEENNLYMKKIISSNSIERNKFTNKIILRNYEYPFNVIDFGDLEGMKIKEEILMKNVLKNVFIIKFKQNFLDIFEICEKINNEIFNYSIIKIDDNKAFIEISFDEETQEFALFEKVFNELKSNEKIEEMINYNTFEKNKFMNIFQ